MLAYGEIDTKQFENDKNTFLNDLRKYNRANTNFN